MKIEASRRSFRYGQWSLIGLLVTLVIIMILAATYYPQIAARHSQPGEARTPQERAYGAACDEYVAQMNDAVVMYRQDHDDQPPRSFQDLKKYGVTDDILDAQGCYFKLDPVSGQVSDVGQGAYQGATPPAYTNNGQSATPAGGYTQGDQQQGQTQNYDDSGGDPQQGQPTGDESQGDQQNQPQHQDRPVVIGPGGIQIPTEPDSVDPGN